VGAEPANRQRRKGLHEPPGEEGETSHHTGRDFAQTDGQRECGQVGFAKSDHSPKSGTLQLTGNQVLAEVPLGAVARETMAVRRAGRSSDRLIGGGWLANVSGGEGSGYHDRKGWRKRRTGYAKKQLRDLTTRGGRRGR
jgi:hypothetical protein